MFHITDSATSNLMVNSALKLEQMLSQMFYVRTIMGLKYMAM